jgi:hypothetical protein
VAWHWHGQAQPFSDNFVTPNGSGGLFLAALYSIEWGRRGSSVRETFFGLGCRLVIQLMSRLVFFLCVTAADVGCIITFTI